MNAVIKRFCEAWLIPVTLLITTLVGGGMRRSITRIQHCNTSMRRWP